MATSLQRQLAALAAPASALLRPDRKRVSIIFTSEEAAKHDRETFYRIGIDGLTDLISTCPDLFSPFATTILFSEQGKYFERSVEDAQLNKQVDQLVGQFLVTLSPYLMLKSSMKCLEWLVYRFHIETFNVSQLLECCLPYYDTKQFVMIAQALQFGGASDPTRVQWEWLIPSITSGAIVRKSVLYGNVNGPFVLWLFETFRKFIQIHKDHQDNLSTFLNFIVSTVVGVVTKFSRDFSIRREVKAVKGRKTVVDAVLNQIYTLFDELCSEPRYHRLRSNREIYSAAYVMIATIGIAAEENPELSETLGPIIKRIFNILIANREVILLEETYLLIEMLVHRIYFDWNIKSAKKLKMALFDLAKVSQDWDVSRVAAKILVVNAREGYIKPSVLFKSLARIQLTPEARSEILRSCYVAYKETRLIFAKKLLSRFEVEYPAEFSLACELDPQFAQDLVSLKRRKDFLLMLNHPDANFRAKAIRKVIRNLTNNQIKKGVSKKPSIKTKKSLLPDKNPVAAALLDKFHDDSEAVAKTLLVSKKLLEVFKPETVVEGCISVLKKAKGMKVKRIAIKKLCFAAEKICGDEKAEKQVINALVPYMFPRKPADVKVAMLVLNSPFFASTKLLKKSKKVKKMMGEDAHEICTYSHELLKNSTTNCFDLPEEGLPSAVSLSIAFLMLQNEDNLVKFIATAKKLGLKATSEFPVKAASFGNCIRPAQSRNVVSVELILSSILGLTQLTLRTKLDVIKFVWDLSENQKFRGACMHFLASFLKKLTPQEGSQFWFWLKTLIDVVTGGGDAVQREFYLLRCLQFFTAYVRNHGIPAGVPGRKGAQPVSPSWCLLEVLLSKCVQHESQRVRKLCLAFLEEIRKVPQLSVDWEDLVTRILAYSNEILADGSQAAPLIGKAVVDAKLERVRTEMIKALGSPETNKDIFAGLVNICQHTGSLMSSELEPMIGKLLEVNPQSNQLLALLNCFQITPKSVHLVPKVLEVKECVKIVLKHLNSKLYASADAKFKKQLFRLMIDAAVSCKNAETKQAIQRCVRKWEVESGLIAQELNSCVEAERKLAVATARKQIEGTEVWQTWKEQAEVILEFSQGMKILKNFKPLLIPLFKILKICITLEEQSPVEYLKQLTLTALTMCCGDESEEVTDGTFQVELVIDCLRCSRNPQTHHHALILLNYAAKRFHEQVLHGVMSLFTFMGNSILRQDDTYSTQLIQQTVTTIIPALTKSARGGPIERKILSSGIFRVFTSALVDIPVHRRLPVLSSLVETLNPEECLWQLLIIIVDNALNRDRKRGNLNADLELAVELAWLYGQQTAVTSLTKIYEFFQSISSSLFIKSESVSEQELLSLQKRQQPQDKAVLDFSRKETYRDIQLVVYYTIELMMKIATKFAEADAESSSKIDYDRILECCLSFSRTAGGPKDNKICRLISQRNLEVMEKINQVLEPEDFVRVITVILGRKEMPIQRKILDMLNTRLVQKADWFGDLSILLQLVDPLLELSKQDPDSDEIVTTIQTSFLSLKLIAKHLAFQNPEEFHPVFELSLEYVSHDHHLLCASALLCLGELFCLKSLLLPSLSQVTSAILRAFKASLKLHRVEEDLLGSQDNDCEKISSSGGESSTTTAHLLCISTIACMNKMVEQLGSLMGSKFLKKALILVLTIDTHYSSLEASSPRKKVFDQRLRALLKTIAVKIPLRNSLIPLKEAFQGLYLKPKAEQALMVIIKEALLATGKQDFVMILPPLCDAFMEEFLGYRNNVAGEEESVNEEDVSSVENSVVDCLISGAVLKMSEGMFRPYYHKLFDWAKESTEKLVTFFRFSSMAAERLKSLFVTFAGYVMNEAVTYLNKGVKLNEGILGFFFHVFSNDREGFVTTDRFNALVKPLVEMLECEDVLNGHISLKTLTDCLIQLAVASNDLNRWQYMMDLVSTKASHSQKRVRLNVVAMFEAAAAELAKDFLPVLPAVVPFLAELMNDDEPEVESATQKMLLKLEAIVGEPLQSYFS